MNIWGENLDCCADSKWATSMENQDYLSVIEHTKSKEQVRENLKVQGSEVTFVQNYKHINSIQWTNPDH